MPATRPTSAVLVCVRRRIATAKVTPTRVARPLSRRPSQSTTVSPAATAAYWATCVGSHWPDHPFEPAFESSGVTRGDQKAEHHRAERHVEAAKMTPEKQHVSPAPPRRQQPERDHELGEPEGPEQLTEVRSCRGGDHRVHDEQAHEAEEHVRAHPDLGVHGQCHQERQRQGALREPLADVGRDVQEDHRGCRSGC